MCGSRDRRGKLRIDATGVDLAANSLRTAQDKVRSRGSTVRFLQYDARRPAEARAGDPAT